MIAWSSLQRSMPGTVLAAAILLGACAGTPPPDWQLNAKSALDHAVTAHLNGNARTEAAELARARREIARTGRIDFAARVELAYCAAHVASLAFEPCTAFEALRADTMPAERAYADYLYSTVPAQASALLSPAQRAVVGVTNAPGAAHQVLTSIDDPLSRLVAAAVLFRSGRADPATITLAVETASAQGWRRPLLAWLRLELALAEKTGATDEVARLQRRIALVLGE